MALVRVPLADGTVTLRPITAADGSAVLAALSSDPTVSRWTRVPWPYGRSQLDEFLRAVDTWHAGHTDIALAVVDAATGAFLGCMGLHRVGQPEVARSAFLPDEVGYWVLASARCRGVATRALRLLTRHALVELGRPQVNLQTKVGNDASVAVARKVGFRYVGRVAASEVDDDVFDHDRFVLTADLAAAGDALARERGLDRGVIPSAP